MIIGKGLIATTFHKYQDIKDIIIFASGVSNSNEVDMCKFEREEELLRNTLSLNTLIIYFSSCSLEDRELKNTPYHLHKKRMEDIVLKEANRYLIFRVPNILGYGGNKNTIINYLYDAIDKNNRFTLWENATRNIIDIETLEAIISYIIDNNVFINEIINIAYNKNTKVIDIVHAIEIVLNKKASFEVIDKGVDLRIDNSKVLNILKILNIKQLSINYLINKYKG